MAFHLRNMPCDIYAIGSLPFRPDEHGWVAVLPAAVALFQGHPVRFNISTRVFADDPRELPLPTGPQQSLANFLLKHIDEALFQCAVRLKSYCPDPTFFDAMEVELWIQAEEDSEGPTCWTMVVERRDDEDDGYHLCFEELEFVDMFGYDDFEEQED